MVQPSAETSVAFVALVLALIAAPVLGSIWAGRRLDEPPRITRRFTKRAIIGVTALVVITTGIVASGMLEADVMPPPPMPFMAGCLAFVVIAAFGKLSTRLIDGLPIAALIGVQGFRLPLELILHRWYTQGVLPVQMTYEGHNFDIVTGIAALVVAALLHKGIGGRGLVWAFNLLGTGLLVTVATIAVLSSPLPIRQYLNDPPVLFVYHVPYFLIVPICVGGALYGHLLVFRWLLRRP